MTETAEQHPKPELALNRPEDGETVAAALRGFIGHATEFKDGASLDIATAYFNVGGYALLADALQQANGVRLLLGVEPEIPEVHNRALNTESPRPAQAVRQRLEQDLEHLLQNLTTERDLLGFTPETDADTQRLVDWLRSDTVQVRRLEDRFLHGKAFIAGDRSHGVVAGSSNFTRAGLSTNIELNLGNYSPHVVDRVQDWFQELWEAAQPYDLAALFEGRFVEHTPQLIYLRMLWERYGDELKEEQEAAGASGIQLTSFQTDGVWRAKRILEQHHGVLVADEVGLGKTFLAGALIEEAAHELRQRVLVIAPASLRDGPWYAFVKNHNLNAELVSYEQLLADERLNPERTDTRHLDANPDQYALVVVDEAHNLRSPNTQRANALRRLMAGSPPKKLVLLTATPVNNSLQDLYWQLAYFLKNDSVFADVGIGSLRDRFKQVTDLHPNDLSPQYLFDVLDAVAVRRTRSFIKHHYANDTVIINGEEKTISFPTPRVHKVEYDLDGVLPGFFDRLAAALAPPDADAETTDTAQVLTLARYSPSAYLRAGREDAREESREVQLVGLLRSMLLKRFESSPHAFANTCEKMAKSCEAFTTLLAAGKVGVGAALADWMATDSDDFDEIDQYLDGHHEGLEDASDYDVDRLAADATADAALFRSLAAEARRVTIRNDPNLAVLADVLAGIAADAAAQGIGPQHTRDQRKVLIFSYYADTADWIHEYLLEAVRHDPRLADYADRVAVLKGGDSSATQKDDVLWGFAPRTTQAPEGRDADRYDILVATDVLAEGVNLQQAQHIINYDLPWNPMRLVQRHGRIDRIGSQHSEVFLHCVFPDTRLDDLLDLEERLQHKLLQAAAAVGVGTVLPEQRAEAMDRDFSETREEIQRLRHEEAGLFERGGTAMGVLSGEEYRQELRQVFDPTQGKPDLAEQIKSLAWGSGSGMASPLVPDGRRGYVFCIRVGDWKQPLFRYVELDDSTGEVVKVVGSQSLIITDTLECLHRARPEDDTARLLSEETQAQVYQAWKVVQEDLWDGWNFFSDKANLEPSIPRALREAAELVRSYPPEGYTQEDVDRLVESIQVPHLPRIVNEFRSALRSAVGDPAKQAQKVAQVVEDQGLQPSVAAKPLPQITADDVHLVCWLALVPEAS